MCHYCALLVNDETRLNGHAAKGAPTIVSYAFTVRGDLPGGNSAVADAKLTASVRAAVEVAEGAAGLAFVEVDASADAMMRFYYNGDRDGWSWATLPRVAAWNGNVATDVAMNRHYGDYQPGSGGFQVLLHEIGHAMGLKHPHDGATRLPGALDNTNNTVMSYNWRGADKADYQALDRAALQSLYGRAGALKGVEAEWDGARDILMVRGTPGRDTIVGINDRTDLVGGAGGDRLIGRGADDTLRGRDGADTLRGNDGVDLLLGGERGDRLWGGWGDDRLMGSDGHDGLFGEWGRDRLRGGLGRDTLVGGRDADRLAGNGGKDVLKGEEGDDRLLGGTGADRLLGGAGADIFVLRPGEGADTIVDFDPAAGDRIDVRAFGWSRAALEARLASEGTRVLLDVGDAVVTLLRAANKVDEGDFWV